MKHELKVIMGDASHNTRVLLDDEPIGLVQEISFHAKASETGTKVVLVFPRPEDLPHNSPLVNDLKKTLETLKEMPHVGVILQPIW